MVTVGQKSKTDLRVLTLQCVLFLLEAWGESLFLAFSSFWHLSTFLDLWLHPSDLCLHCHISDSSASTFCLLSTLMITLNPPGESNVLPILSPLTTPAKSLLPRKLHTHRSWWLYRHIWGVIILSTESFFLLHMLIDPLSFSYHKISITSSFT